jgi:hypothetical protein
MSEEVMSDIPVLITQSPSSLALTQELASSKSKSCRSSTRFANSGSCLRLLFLFLISQSGSGLAVSEPEIVYTGTAERLEIFIVAATWVDNYGGGFKEFGKKFAGAGRADLMGSAPERGARGACALIAFSSFSAQHTSTSSGLRWGVETPVCAAVHNHLSALEAYPYASYPPLRARCSHRCFRNAIPSLHHPPPG